jgi:hypothetical protein
VPVSRVCLWTAAWCFRKWAHENRERHQAMVVESNAYRLWSSSTPDGIVTVKRSRDADQNLRTVSEDCPVATFVGVGKVERATLPRKPAS